jgi:hypothetical protein
LLHNKRRFADPFIEFEASNINDVNSSFYLLSDGFDLVPDDFLAKDLAVNLLIKRSRI